MWSTASPSIGFDNQRYLWRALSNPAFPSIGFGNKPYLWRALSNLAFPSIGFDNKRYSWRTLSNQAFPNIGFDNKRYSWRALSNVVGSEKESHVNSNSLNKNLHLGECVGCTLHCMQICRSARQKLRKRTHKRLMRSSWQMHVRSVHKMQSESQQRAQQRLSRPRVCQ